MSDDRPWAERFEEVVARYRHEEAMPGAVRRLAHVLCWSGAGSDLPRVSPDLLTQARYVALRLDGQGHALADMLAHAAPPMSHTDREFLEGHCNGSQFEQTPEHGDFYAAVARRAGVNPTGKVYLSGLAAFPGDPEAWVSGRGDVERVLDARGWGAEGAVARKVTKVGEPLNLAVGEDLIEDEMEEVALADPGLARDPEGLRERVLARRKPHWSK